MNTKLWKYGLSTIKQYTTHSDAYGSRQHGTVLFFLYAWVEQTVFSSTASHTILYNDSELKLNHVKPV